MKPGPDIKVVPITTVAMSPSRPWKESIVAAGCIVFNALYSDLRSFLLMYSALSLYGVMMTTYSFVRVGHPSKGH